MTVTVEVPDDVQYLAAGYYMSVERVINEALEAYTKANKYRVAKGREIVRLEALAEAEALQETPVPVEVAPDGACTQVGGVVYGPGVRIRTGRRR